MPNGIIAGSFDIIHPGYALMFKEAKDIVCDHLTIALHSDPTLENQKKLKCILTIEERMLILKSIRYIDDIVVYNTEKELENLLKFGNFDVRILGEDYKKKQITGSQYCAKIFFIERKHDWSTTKFKRLISESYLSSI